MSLPSCYTKVSKSHGPILTGQIPLGSTTFILPDSQSFNLLDPNIRLTGKLKTIKQSGLPHGHLVSTSGSILPGTPQVSMKTMKKLATLQSQISAQSRPYCPELAMMASSSSSSSSLVTINTKSKRSRKEITSTKSKSKSSKEKGKKQRTIKDSSSSSKKKKKKKEKKETPKKSKKPSKKTTKKIGIEELD